MFSSFVALVCLQLFDIYKFDTFFLGHRIGNIQYYSDIKELHLCLILFQEIRIEESNSRKFLEESNSKTFISWLFNHSDHSRLFHE